ncbi:MAG: hypothetical protein H7Z40_11495 [Phycisphaerae bacterium]|nr:hypothetical protein [Gemmatimonadaceae bacterium]
MIRTLLNFTCKSRCVAAGLGAIVLLLNTACSEDAVLTAPTNSEPVLALNPSAEDRTSLDAAIAAVDNSWNSMDATAYAANFASDARATTPLGVLLIDRAGVLTAHQGLFAGPFRGSRRASVVSNILWLAATRAAVERTNELTGYQFLPPGLQATLPGIVRTRESLVFERRSVTWTIVRAQLTGVPPTP